MKLRGYQITGFFLTSVLGTMLHFVYDWTGGSVYAAAFSAVNESVWEHVRLLMIPFLLYTLFEYISYGRFVTNFAPVKCVSLILGMLVIISGYYTINGIFGSSGMVIDIILFYSAVLCSYGFSWAKLNTLTFCSFAGRVLGALGLIALAAAAVALTYYPPHIPLFLDVKGGFYGIPQHF